MTADAPAQDPIQAFYEKYPHPDPIPELPPPILNGTGRLEGCPSWYFHTYWPRETYRGDLDVLIAGCGTSQAAVYAASLPDARIVGIDVSADSLEHSKALAAKHGLKNLEHRQMGLEQAGKLKHKFDLVICTGVLHHLPDPDAGLRALRGVVRRGGSLNLMVYAKYGRSGVQYLQDMMRRIGLSAATSTDADLDGIRSIIASLPKDHPLSTKATVLSDGRTKAGITDLYLNPREIAYSVPEVYAFLARCGLKLQEWSARSQYEPQALGMKAGALSERISRLPQAERYAVGEVYSTRILRHRFIACRDDRPAASYEIDLDGPDWQQLMPVRHRSIQVLDGARAEGRSPWFALPHHRQDGIRINLAPDDAARLNRADGEHTIASLYGGSVDPGREANVRALWRRLYQLDFVWFRAPLG